MDSARCDDALADIRMDYAAVIHVEPVAYKAAAMTRQDAFKYDGLACADIQQVVVDCIP